MFKRLKKCRKFNSGPLNMHPDNHGVFFDRWVNGVCIKCADHTCEWYEKFKEYHDKSQKEQKKQKVQPKGG